MLKHSESECFYRKKKSKPSDLVKRYDFKFTEQVSNMLKIKRQICTWCLNHSIFEYANKLNPIIFTTELEWQQTGN